MKLQYISILFFAIALAVFGMVSCENSLEDYQPDPGIDLYFPLKVGHTWTYQLDSIIYDNNGSRIDTVSLQVREEITDTFVDPAGETNFRISRSEYIDDQWKIADIWTASNDDNNAFRVEENLRFARLSTPVKEGNSWDGNAYFDTEIIVKIAGEPIRVYSNWGDYTYTSVGISEDIFGTTFDNLCVVNQVDQEDRISRRYSIEKYAEDVGLVYKKMIILNTQKFDSTAPWEEKAEEGFILEQYLLDFQPGN